MSELNILYDEDFISSLPNFIRGRYNSLVVAIFKSPSHDVRKIAEQIEAWYKELPVRFRKNFYNRLRDKSVKSLDFVGALAELYVHHWFFKIFQISSIEYESPVGRGNPDFRVSFTEFLGETRFLSAK